MSLPARARAPVPPCARELRRRNAELLRQCRPPLELCPGGGLTPAALRTLWVAWTVASEEVAAQANREWRNTASDVERLAVALDEGYALGDRVERAYREAKLELWRS